MKNKVTVFFVIFLLLSGGVFLYTKWTKTKNSFIKAKGPFNVILISIDTLRRDHIGLYGYDKDTSPNIDKFGKDSVMFQTVVAQAPSTLPSHASIFTSLIPSHHGAFATMNKPIPDELITMAEILKDNGYKTASFNGGGQISAEFGLSQGFDVYESVPSVDTELEKFTETVERGKKWVANNEKEKFFLFLHTYETHIPYVPGKKFLEFFPSNYSGKIPNYVGSRFIDKINMKLVNVNQEDIDHVIRLYDAGIRSMDAGFKNLVDFLKDRNIFDNTVIIFTSDHGEEFGEHGMMAYHSHSLYDELLLIPLIIKFPNSSFAGMKVPDQIASIDILPTLLDILDIPHPNQFEGVSLKNLIKGGKHSEFAVSERDVAFAIIPSSIRTEKWKLYKNRTYFNMHSDGGMFKSMLFDLKSDPSEKTDKSKDAKERLHHMDILLSNFLKKKKAISTKQVKPKKDTLERLKALGYIN